MEAAEGERQRETHGRTGDGDLELGPRGLGLIDHLRGAAEDEKRDAADADPMPKGYHGM